MASADPTAAALQAQGEQLARNGRFTEAIEAFKAADKLEASATHACLISLAYTRRELWPQAEIFLAKCHRLETTGDPLPDWVPEVEKLINDRVGSANVAAVEIEVTPHDLPVNLSVSSFAPDELFEPRTIHLSPGHHVITATAPGYATQRKELDIPDKTPQHVIIDLAPPKVARAVVPYTLPRKLIVAGSITIGAGVVAYAVMGIGYLKLKGHTNFGTGYETMYDVGRVGSIGLWTIGAGLVVTGYVLRSKHHDPEAPAVSAMPLREGGGIVTVGWTR